jgi:hypothetical protein
MQLVAGIAAILFLVGANLYAFTDFEWTVKEQWQAFRALTDPEPGELPALDEYLVCRASEHAVEARFREWGR